MFAGARQGNNPAGFSPALFFPRHVRRYPFSQLRRAAAVNGAGYGKNQLKDGIRNNSNGNRKNKQRQKPSLGGSAHPRPQGVSPVFRAGRCAPLVQTKGLSVLAPLLCKPWEIPLPLHLLPPLAWARAKA